MKEHPHGETAAAGRGLALHLPLGPVDSGAVKVATPGAKPVQSAVESGSKLIGSRGVHTLSVAPEG